MSKHDTECLWCVTTPRLLLVTTLTSPPYSIICSVGMMALKAGEMEQEKAKAVVAHSPVETKVSPINKGFAASGAQQ